MHIYNNKNSTIKHLFPSGCCSFLEHNVHWMGFQVNQCTKYKKMFFIEFFNFPETFKHLNVKINWVLNDYNFIKELPTVKKNDEFREISGKPWRMQIIILNILLSYIIDKHTKERNKFYIWNRESMSD